MNHYPEKLWIKYAGSVIRIIDVFGPIPPLLEYPDLFG